MAKRKTTSTAHIYAIRCGAHVKIGRARNVRTRFSELQTGSPEPHTLVFAVTVSADEAPDIEKHVHAQLKHCRVRGEWFTVSDAEARSVVEAAAGELAWCLRLTGKKFPTMREMYQAHQEQLHLRCLDDLDFYRRRHQKREYRDTYRKLVLRGCDIPPEFPPPDVVFPPKETKK